MRAALSTFFLSIVLLFAPSLLLADTVSDLQAAIQALAARIATLQPQNSGSTTGTVTGPSGPVSTVLTCPITHALARGSRGDDVLCLQDIFIQMGLLTADSATGYFGALTEGAVQHFQSQNGIVSSGDPASTGFGVVGPRTRAALLTALSKASQQATTSSGSSANTSTGSQSTSPSGSCILNGFVIANGASYTAYQSPSVPYGSQCVPEVRLCANGSLSGTATAVYCTVAAASSCAFGSGTIADGSAVIAYAAPSVPAGSQCVGQARYCTNGVLSGSYTYGTCTPAVASCTIGSITMQDGENRTFFASSSLPYGSLCDAVSNVQMRRCSNGVLSGDSSFSNTNCTVPTQPPVCMFAGNTIPNASSTIAYDATCNTQVRSCTNGVLSGTYAYAQCPLASCTLDGVTLASGQSHTFYNTTYAQYAFIGCVAKSRTCTNGVLSDGTTAYGVANKATCP